MAQISDIERVVDWQHTNMVVGPHIVEGPNPIDRATRLGQLQKQRWLDLYDIAPGFFNEAGLDRLAQFASQENVFNVREADDKAVVSAALPILLADPDDLRAVRDKRTLVAAFLQAIASLAPTLVGESFLVPAKMTMVGDARLRKSIDDLAARIDTLQASGRIGRTAEQTNADIQRTRKSLAERMAAFEQARVEVFNSLDAHSKDIQAKLADAVSKSVEEVSRLREAQKALVTIAPIVGLWTSKTSAHRLSFFLAAALFIAIVVATGLVCWRHADRYIQSIVGVVGDRQILGSALVAAPIIAIAWVLRLVSRFAITNLSLWHDASQRKATVETFLSLLGEDRAALSKEERALALAALFRPIPGGSSSDIDPPSFLDFIRGKDLSQS